MHADFRQEPPRQWHGVRRLLVIRLDNIGDVIMLGPALRLIRQTLPEVEMTLLASPAGALAARLLPWIDNVWELSAVWQDAFNEIPQDREREGELVRRVEGGRFDAALIFTSFSQSPYPPAYVCYLAGVPIRAGMSNEFGGSLLSSWVRAPDPSMHQAERNLYLLECLGFARASPLLEIRIPEEDKRNAVEAMAAAGLEEGRPFVAVAPGATCQARRWDAGKFAELSELIAARLRMPVVIVGKQGECRIRRKHPLVFELLARTSVGGFAHILSLAELVVANDSAAMHFADAFKRPAVILFSGTDLESQWRPRSSRAILIRKPTACAPCYKFVCPYHMECLDVSVQEVCAEVCKLMAPKPASGLAIFPDANRV